MLIDERFKIQRELLQSFGAPSQSKFENFEKKKKKENIKFYLFLLIIFLIIATPVFLIFRDLQRAEFQATYENDISANEEGTGELIQQDVAPRISDDCLAKFSPSAVPGFSFDYNSCDWTVTQTKIDPRYSLVIIVSNQDTQLTIGLGYSAYNSGQIICSNEGTYTISDELGYTRIYYKDPKHFLYLPKVVTRMDEEEFKLMLARASEQKEVSTFCFDTSEKFGPKDKSYYVDLTLDYPQEFSRATIETVDELVKSMTFN